jgi:hypothetical protein
MLKGSKLYSIFKNRCPRCQKGKFFVTDNPYDLKQFSKMHSKCGVCYENFEREVGFYYGAMYASYGIDVLLGILMFVVMVPLLNLSLLTFLFTYTGTAILLFPVIYRLSRLVWINLFVKYNPDFFQEN